MFKFNPKNFKNIFQTESNNTEGDEDNVLSIDKSHILKEFKINTKESIEDNKELNLEETEMSDKTKLDSAVNTIASYFKNALSINNEVEAEVEVEQPQDELEVSEDEEVQQAEETPEQDGGAQDVPEVQEEPVADGEEPEVDSENVEPQQEEPAELEDTEIPQEQREELENDLETENEPSVEVEDSIIPEVEASVDLVKQLADMQAKLDALTSEKETIVAKAELQKEVENKFKGVPGKLEDKVDKIYNIKNSNLSDAEKEFILNGLSQLSEQNLKDCEEVGHSEEIDASLSEEEKKLSEAKALAKKEGISEGKALLVLDKQMTLEQAKKNKK